MGVCEMGRENSKYVIVYRGEVLKYLIPGQFVFFQRKKEYGGGFWLGKTHENGFEFVLEQPTSLSYGLAYLIRLSSVEARHMEFVDDIDDFKLT
ncbi:hypothetical protein BS856_13805 [Salmonella enterica]|nr:hypothetical protein [Salmonella enterica]EBR9914246.1 hypothetical protein [Salmonella enterica subsp. enterica serovar Virchow]EBS5296851.1 hypothetical protein [Salmonella enterica subsp. enterica serovar Infantis]EBU8358231.1 hypothetical protein [Salmonella enterica subsp. enterica serovar Typhimurium]EBW9719578.1 hypothetical protein [Salmonella enterica subsp. enterica serovar Bareilly]EBX4175813.1 hypothetical protein [Salmonella enterica subsp. enterica serovar Oranienburg]EBY4776